MIRLVRAAVILLLTTGVALAVKAPKLPASARKLTASEITALYDRIPFRFHNFTGKLAVTGTFLVNFAKKTASGTYVEGKDKGTRKGRVRIKGNKFCRKIENHREGCVFLCRWQQCL